MAHAPPMPPAATAPAGDGGPTIRRRRSLPGGRAVLGAFLVVVAAVGTFGAYLQATAAPATTYLVAVRAFEIGHLIEQSDLTGPNPGFVAVAMELPEAQATRAIGATTAGAAGLVGTVVVAPIAGDDLLQRTQFVAVGDAGDGVSMSFSLPFDRALAGTVGPGERIDVIATFAGAGAAGSETRVVARAVTVVRAASGSDSLTGGRVTLTVELPDLATAQRLQHAVDTAQVAVVRGSDPAAPDPAATTGTTAPTAPASSGAAPADDREQG